MGTDWIQDLRVVDLKEELKKRDLLVSGKKAELVARLTEAVVAEGAQAGGKDAAPAVQEQPSQVVGGADTTAKESEAQQASADGKGEEEDTAKKAASAAGAAVTEKKTEPSAAGISAKESEEATTSAAADAPTTEPEKPSPAAEEKAAEPEAAPASKAGADDGERAAVNRLSSMQAALLAAQPVAVDTDMEEAVDFDGDVEEAEAKPKPAEAKEESQKQPRESSEAAEEPVAKRLKQEDGTPVSAHKRKREPIPLFRPRERSTGGSSVKLDPSTDEKPSSDGKRVSVFNRIATQEGEAPAPAGKGAPPSRVQATRALLVTGFIRPFTVVAARNLFNSYGEVEKMWMPSIRDKAYVIYKSEEAAEAARQATHGLEWPQGNRTSLRPKFVPLEEAETVIDSDGKNTPGKATTVAGSANPAVSALAAATAEAAGVPLERRRSDRMEKRVSDPKRTKPEAKPPAKEEKKTVGLDDLFRRTSAKPHLYWLPLTEAQIAAKRSSARQKA